MKRVADYIIANLEKVGITQYFSLTGRGLLYLTDALSSNEKTNKVFMHHEQSCAYAACGYTDVNSTPAVCMISTGCGSTNAISGVLNAWQDNLPVIFISGQNKLDETTYYTKAKIRTYGNQEANIIELVEPITKYAVMVDDPSKIKDILTTAIVRAMSDRKGPVWIDVPLDIQNQFVELDDIDINLCNFHDFDNSVIDHKVIENELEVASKPLLLIGSGIRDAKVIDQLKDWIELNELPCVFTPSAADILDTNNKYSIGTIGMLGGSMSGNIVLQHSDLVIILGSRLSSVTTGGNLDDFARNAKLIVVDIDSDEHSKMSSRIDTFLNYNLTSLFKLLSKKVVKQNPEWHEFIIKTKEEFPLNKIFENENQIDLHQLSIELTKYSNEFEHFVVDSGLNEIILPAVGNFSPKKRCIHPYSQGSMGYALPASIGVHHASKKRVYSMIGDGSIMLNIQELQTIAFNNYPIVIYIINNQDYSIIRTRQKELFRNRTIGTDRTNGVTTPNYQDIANAFKIRYSRISNHGDLKNIQVLLDYEGPQIIEVFTDPEQKYLKPGVIKSESGKFRLTYLDELHKIL